MLSLSFGTISNLCVAANSEMNSECVVLTVPLFKYRCRAHTISQVQPYVATYGTRSCRNSNIVASISLVVPVWHATKKLDISLFHECVKHSYNTMYSCRTAEIYVFMWCIACRKNDIPVFQFPSPQLCHYRNLSSDLQGSVEHSLRITHIVDARLCNNIRPYVHLVVLCVNFEILFFRSFLNALLLLEREFQKYLAKQLENLQEKCFFSLV